MRFAFAPVVRAPEPGRRAHVAPARCAGPRGAPGAARARFPAHEEDDPPDPIVDGKIDLGALAAEFVALALDPYPRKPGARFEPVDVEPDRERIPFAGLARLKKDQ